MSTETHAPSTAQFPEETNPRGAWVRQASAFRNRVTRDGSSGHPAAAGRYHLYVSLACPWASRAVIARSLEGLEEAVPMTVVDPIRDEKGWRFRASAPDPNEGFEYLAEAYRATDPSVRGRVTVPVLWDRERRVIVNNESADILRMLDTEFDEWARTPVELRPPDLADAIDEINERVYRDVNDGVYACGFAASQEAYDAAYERLFAALDWLEERLSTRRYLLGDRITEADWRLFTTLVRFDVVYHGHFKCNRNKLAERPVLWGYLRDLYQVPGIAETVDFDHVKRHYHVTHRRLNPSGIVPRGPDLDFEAPHDRARLSARGDEA